MKWVSLPLLALVLSLPICDRAVSQTSSTREQNKQRVNDNVLFLMGGQPGATFNQIANDISVVLGVGNNLRVLSVDGGAAVQNVEDVLFLRNIDMALTTQETLNYLKDTGELGKNLTQKLTYIAALFPNPLQILARSGATSIKDLSGKKVSFNNKGSATAQFVPKLFKTSGDRRAGVLHVARRRIGETPTWRDRRYNMLLSDTGPGICECQAGLGLAVRFRTLREVDPGELSACFDRKRRLSHSDREGRECGYNCRKHHPNFIQLAKRHGAIRTDCKVRRCILLENQRVLQAAA